MNLKLSIVNYQLSIFVAIVTFFAIPLKAQVTIGAQKAPHSYSVLELTSTKGGFRLPMLSSDERDALKLTSDSTEAGGLFIYNTDINCVEFWSDGKWIDLCSATPAGSIVNSITLTSAAGTDDQTVCGGAGITPVTYATTGATGATFIGLPAGVSGSWDAGVVTISGRPATSGNYIVVLTGGNGSGMAIGTITVNKVLSAISGNNGVTKGATGLTYSVTPVSGVTTYTWTVPTGWSITAGQGTYSITVTASSIDEPAGTITVTANNGNCTGTSTLAVSVGCPVKTVSGSWLTFMCYNLGAADAIKSLTPTQQAAYTTPEDEYGDWYQWGRQADGYQLRTSQAYPTNNTSDESSGIVSNPNLDGNGQVVSTFEASGKFIKSNTDWRNPQDNTLWYSNDKTVNDPCPAGWRVPTHVEWATMIQNNGTVNTRIWNSSGTAGYLIKPLGNSDATLFLPAGGYRFSNNSIEINVGSAGYYYSSSTNGIYAYSLNFDGIGINPDNNSSRANGFSIRCIAK